MRGGREVRPDNGMKAQGEADGSSRSNTYPDPDSLAHPGAHSHLGALRGDVRVAGHGETRPRLVVPQRDADGSAHLALAALGDLAEVVDEAHEDGAGAADLILGRGTVGVDIRLVGEAGRGQGGSHLAILDRLLLLLLLAD